MKRTVLLSVMMVACAGPFGPPGGAAPTPPDELRSPCQEFEVWSGARLVFDRSQLPESPYYDRMPALTREGQVRAARIALHEVRKLPPEYLRAIGLKDIGIFQACVSVKGDGFREYDAQVGGYRFYGIWNGRDALACAFYTGAQLPQTLHHEVFHHVDAAAGKAAAGGRAVEDRFLEIQAGRVVYRPPVLAAEDLAALRKQSGGHVLESALSDYARKSPAEDKAETARYLMTHLPDALVQVVTRPELPGSQRLLYVLDRYRAAFASADLGWFVDTALGRAGKAAAREAVASPSPGREDPPAEVGPARTLRQLNEHPLTPRWDEAARRVLRQTTELTGREFDGAEADEIVRQGTALVLQLMRTRIQPRNGDREFTVHGREDAQGVNRTLRQDVAEFGRDAAVLRRILSLSPTGPERAACQTLQALRLLARYYVFIAGSWEVTPGTRQVFGAARDELVANLPAALAGELRTVTGLDWRRLAEAVSADGQLRSASRFPAPANHYLERVDQAIADPAVRETIRQVQPACVRLDGGSGVNLTPSGCLLTNAHVARRVGNKLPAQFPDGRQLEAVCTALDARLDLALCQLQVKGALPFAPLAKVAPAPGTQVICIGQPGAHTPGGEPTGYQPFHVSVGAIRGYLDNPLGSQQLGRVKHDAWTYWGHSGSPLFDESGRIVALHNSWDSKTAMRHAVPLQAILHFLGHEKVEFQARD
jgi:hypothetical protein